MATTVAGFTLAGGTGHSELNDPTSIFVLSNGTMYIADSANYRVQKWLPDQPVGFTVAGGRGSGATFDKVGIVNSIFVTEQGNIYVSETSNNRVTLWYAGNTTASQLVYYYYLFSNFLFIYILGGWYRYKWYCIEYTKCSMGGTCRCKSSTLCV